MLESVNTSKYWEGLASLMASRFESAYAIKSLSGLPFGIERHSAGLVTLWNKTPIQNQMDTDVVLSASVDRRAWAHRKVNEVANPIQQQDAGVKRVVWSERIATSTGVRVTINYSLIFMGDKVLSDIMGNIADFEMVCDQGKLIEILRKEILPQAEQTMNTLVSEFILKCQVG